tara:strand:+ start:846 stop:2090 length:1245 start_codon:yes stop_codon:yes gene_type:complete
MNLNFQHIINESIEDNPKIENMMFRLFNREFFNIWRDKDDSPHRTGFRYDNVAQVLDYFGEMVALEQEVVLYFFIKWTLDPNSKWNEEDIGNIFSEFQIDELRGWRDITNIYGILKKLDFFNKTFNTGKTDKDGNPEKLNYYDTMSFSDTEGLYPNMVLSVDGWDDLTELFKNEELAEEVFSEDHSDFFSYYDTPMDEIVSDMTGKAMDSVIESIPAYTDKIMVGVNGGEELYEMGMSEEVVGDDDFLDINPTFINTLRTQIKNNEVDGEDVLEFLLNHGELIDLERDIRSAYERTMNDVIETDMRNRGIEEITELFGSKPDWVENTKSGDSRRYDLKVPIPTELIDRVIEHYIDVESAFVEEQESNFVDAVVEMLDQESDLLDLPNLDYYYPDTTKAKEWFEESLYNYLEMSA